jgi:hypothetical protein
VERLPPNNAGDDEMKTTIELAREAGFPMAWISENDGGVIRWKDIKAFEALVRADEREACAQVVEEYPHWLGMTAKAEIANAIRSRGNI